MAFCVSISIFRKSVYFPRVAFNISAPLLNVSQFLRTGWAARCPGTNNGQGFRFTPACFITSDAFLGRLAKGKAAETDDSLYHYPASVPPDSAKEISWLVKDPDQPEKSNVLRVAIIGSPNSGKSTLSNQLLGREVVHFIVLASFFSLSCKHHGISQPGVYFPLTPVSLNMISYRCLLFPRKCIPHGPVPSVFSQ
nr:GTPase Era, mitochondrial-like isoform X2 [Oncorhynchus nerka]